MSTMNATEIGTVYGVQAGNGRDERGGAGGDRHRDGEDVVGEQRDAGDLGGQQPEVVAGDDVGAAGGRVGLDRLAVGEDQERQHDQHGDGDRHDQRERGDADGGDEDPQDLLGGVGRRREVVGGEHGQRRGLAQPLVLELLGVQRRPEQPALDPVADAVRRQVDRRLHRQWPGRFVLRGVARPRRGCLRHPPIEGRNVRDKESAKIDRPVQRFRKDADCHRFRGSHIPPRQRVAVRESPRRRRSQTAAVGPRRRKGGVEISPQGAKNAQRPFPAATRRTTRLPGTRSVHAS